MSQNITVRIKRIKTYNTMNIKVNEDEFYTELIKFFIQPLAFDKDPSTYLISFFIISMFTYVGTLIRYTEVKYSTLLRNGRCFPRKSNQDLCQFSYYNEVPEFPSLVETDTCSFFELKAVSIGKLATLKVIKLDENSFKPYTANT